MGDSFPMNFHDPSSPSHPALLHIKGSSFPGGWAEEQSYWFQGIRIRDLAKRGHLYLQPKDYIV
jgi:hypothetical protein